MTHNLATRFTALALAAVVVLASWAQTVSMPLAAAVIA